MNELLVEPGRLLAKHPCWEDGFTEGSEADPGEDGAETDGVEEL